MNIAVWIHTYICIHNPPNAIGTHSCMKRSHVSYHISMVVENFGRRQHLYRILTLELFSYINSVYSTYVCIRCVCLIGKPRPLVSLTYYYLLLSLIHLNIYVLTTHIVNLSSHNNISTTRDLRSYALKSKKHIYCRPVK